MEMTMARAKKKIDYFNLPFEVHYGEIDSIEYEPMQRVGKKISKGTTNKAIAIRNNRSSNIFFSCSDPTNGALIYVLNGGLNEYIPDWLYQEEGEDRYCISETKYSFTLKKGKFAVEFALGEEVEDETEFDYLGEGIEFYEADSSQPDFIILDSDGTRVRIDLDGYKIDDDGDRIEKTPLIQFTEEEAEWVLVTGKDHGDTYGELAAFLTK